MCGASAGLKPNRSLAGRSVFLLTASREVLLAAGQLPVRAPIQQHRVLVPGTTSFDPAQGIPIQEPSSLGERGNIFPRSREESGLRPLGAGSAGADGTPACPQRRCPVEELVAGFPWGKSCLSEATGSRAPACPVAADSASTQTFSHVCQQKQSQGREESGARAKTLPAAEKCWHHVCKPHPSPKKRESRMNPSPKGL